MQRLDTLRFALAGGIYGAGCVALATICSLLGVPGFRPFTDLLLQFYGFYGYSVSSTGIVVGAFWGLIEGFVHFGIFAWLYNLLLGRRWYLNYEAMLARGLRRIRNQAQTRARGPGGVQSDPLRRASRA